MFQREDGTTVTKLSWLAPTKNTDGTDIDYELSYELHVSGEPVMVLPGSLNPDGAYEFPLSDVSALSDPGEYSLTLTAFEVGKPERESTQSNVLVIERLSVPLAPTGFSAE